jgi:YHS domain-containing protein
MQRFRYSVCGLLAISWLTAGVEATGAEPDKVVWRIDLGQAQAEASAQQKSILVAVTAVWCGACRQMQQLTMSDHRVQSAIAAGYIPLMVDADQHPSDIARWGVSAYPTTLLLSADGQVLHRWVGFQSAEPFSSDLVRRSGRPNSPRSEEFVAVSALFPVNSEQAAFAGFCLTSLLDDNKLRLGNPDITATYRGQSVCFFSEEHRKRFERNPDRYWPMANGKCLVTSQEEQTESPGDPRVGVKWRGKLWFFATRDRQEKFLRSPHRFSDRRL